MAYPLLDLTVDNITASLSARIIYSYYENIASESTDNSFFVIKFLQILSELLNQFVTKQKPYRIVDLLERYVWSGRRQMYVEYLSLTRRFGQLVEHDHIECHPYVVQFCQ